MNTYLFSREMKKDSDKEKVRLELHANSYKKAKMNKHSDGKPEASEANTITADSNVKSQYE